MKMKKLFALLLVAAMIIAMCACGNTEPTPSGSGGAVPAGKEGLPVYRDKEVVLTIEMLETNKPGMTALLEKWDALGTNVKIDAIFTSDLVTWATATAPKYAAGNGCDLVFAIAGSASSVSIGGFYNGGYLEDLSNEPWVGEMFDATKDLMTFDGGIYGMDFTFCPLACITYNVDIFEECGVEVPKTFDELIAACKVFNDAGYVPMSWAFGEPAVNSNNVTIMGGNNLSKTNPEWLADAVAGKATFSNTKEWRTTIEQVSALIKAGAFSAGASAMNQNEMITEFASGKSAMMFTYGGHAGLVQTQDPSLRLGQTAFPGVTEDATRVMMQASGCIGINKKCKDMEAAKAFLAWWHTAENMNVFAEASGVISSYQYAAGDLKGTYAAMSDLAANGYFIADMSAKWPNSAFNTLSGQALQGLFADMVDVDGVLTAFDSAFNAD